MDDLYKLIEGKCKERDIKISKLCTEREIGEQCNASESMVSRYISGAVKPPDDVAEKILDVLRNSEQDDDRGLGRDPVCRIKAA